MIVIVAVVVVVAIINTIFISSTTTTTTSIKCIIVIRTTIKLLLWLLSDHACHRLYRCRHHYLLNVLYVWARCSWYEQVVTSSIAWLHEEGYHTVP